MNRQVSGKVFVFGNNIDTDQIYPGRFVELTDAQDIIKYAMHGADPNFVHEFTKGDIIVAGSNFGCGSSREHAAICLKEIGVSAVIATSFARIFYRNGINMGLPLIVCPGLVDKVNKGDTITLDITSGQISNAQSEKIATAEAVSEYSMKILEHGGIKNMLKARFA